MKLIQVIFFKICKISLIFVFLSTAKALDIITAKPNKSAENTAISNGNNWSRYIPNSISQNLEFQDCINPSIVKNNQDNNNFKKKCQLLKSEREKRNGLYTPQFPFGGSGTTPFISPVQSSISPLVGTTASNFQLTTYPAVYNNGNMQNYIPNPNYNPNYPYQNQQYIEQQRGDRRQKFQWTMGSTDRSASTDFTQSSSDQIVKGSERDSYYPGVPIQPGPPGWRLWDRIKQVLSLGDKSLPEFFQEYQLDLLIDLFYSFFKWILFFYISLFLPVYH